jgi:hypothetical protein
MFSAIMPFGYLGTARSNYWSLYRPLPVKPMLISTYYQHTRQYTSINMFIPVLITVLRGRSTDLSVLRFHGIVL